MREKLMCSYEGLLDPDKPPHWMIDGLPVKRLYKRSHVIAALTRPEFSHEILPLPFWLKERFNPVMSGSVVQALGDHHTNLRRAMENIITPEAIRKLGEFITTRADNLIREAVERGVPFDLARITDQITYEVICELLGVEDIKSETQRLQFFRWMDELTAVTSPLKLPRQPDVWAFFDKYVKLRLALGEDKPIDRMLRSDKFNHRDKVALLHLTMTSATITTSYTICAAWTLLKTMNDPVVFGRIRRNAVEGSGNLLTLAYQEALRYATPSRCRVIRVRRWVKLDEHTFWPGQLVDVCFSSANRDRQFRDPHLYNPERSPKPVHIGFGIGDYECPGRGLSGVVSRATLAALFRYAADWRITNVEPGGRLILRMNKLMLSLN